MFALIVVIAFCCLSHATLADQQVLENAHSQLFDRRVTDKNLFAVRAGSAVPPVPLQVIGVILWDEKRIPPPPVRDSSDSRITAQMNTFQK
jgi:hypothetical protein